jgi:hypothetical protein
MKGTFSFICLSVFPSVRLFYCVNNSADFPEVLYWGLLLKYNERLEPEKTSGTFHEKAKNPHDVFSLNSSVIEIPRLKPAENIKANILF